MRIVDERKPKTIEFKNVSISQVFYVKNVEEYGDSPYMRIFGIEDSEGYNLNAVNLRGAQVVEIGKNEPVILCNATLNIC